jgi:hypothetical protein
VADLGILASNWQGTDRTFGQGDFNYDGKIDVVDLGILATNWQANLVASAPAQAAKHQKISLSSELLQVVDQAVR